MSTLAMLFTKYNKEVYGKPIKVPKTLQDKFLQVEIMLTKSGIELEDYALTTFSDRIWIAQQLGYLPTRIFVCTQSLERYVQRLQQGAEVSKKKEYKKEEDWLSIELDFGKNMINNYLWSLDLPVEAVEAAIGYPGWSTHPERQGVMSEAMRIHAAINRVGIGDYKSIADQVQARATKAGRPIKYKKGRGIHIHEDKPEPPVERKLFYRHPQEADDEDVD